MAGRIKSLKNNTNAKLTHYHGTNEQAGNYSKCPEEPLRGRDRDKLFQVTRMEKKDEETEMTALLLFLHFSATTVRGAERERTIVRFRHSFAVSNSFSFFGLGCTHRLPSYPGQNEKKTDR